MSRAKDIAIQKVIDAALIGEKIYLSPHLNTGRIGFLDRVYHEDFIANVSIVHTDIQFTVPFTYTEALRLIETGFIEPRYADT